jgi:predicted nucleic acid-binding protein
MAWFEAIVVLSDLIPGEFALHGVSEDPDDDKYIAAAVEDRAIFVVTGDPDLLEVEEHASVRIVSPRRFLGALV